jgi:pimeloyl-ACP methyl ester carboxylesterase
MSEIGEHHTTIDGASIFSRSETTAAANPGPAVLLIHGLSVSSRPFLPLLRALAPRYPVHALDLPGFGASQAPRHILSVEQLADAVARWMIAVDIERAVVAGHSMGAQVAVELARRHPDLALAVVLISPTGDPAARGIWPWLRRLARDAVREPVRLSLTVARDYLDAGLRRSFGTLRLMNRHPMPAHLSELAQPALLIVGDRDPVVPKDWAREVLERLPNGRFAVIHGGTHGIQYDEPVEIANAIETLIRELNLQ